METRPAEGLVTGSFRTVTANVGSTLTTAPQPTQTIVSAMGQGYVPDTETSGSVEACMWGAQLVTGHNDASSWQRYPVSHPTDMDSLHRASCFQASWMEISRVNRIPNVVLLLSPAPTHESEVLVVSACTTFQQREVRVPVLRPPSSGRG
jgi:hypothetical protein